MKREQKYGMTLIVVGVLSLPFFIGIPLLATGILLLVKGDRVNAERWIRVLFWIVLAALALAIALLVAFPVEKACSAESGIARSILCCTPAFLAILVSLAMAALTLARFQSLSQKHRIMGLGFGVLCVLGACIALVFAFPWQALGMAGLSAVVWACMAWRKRRRACRAEALRNASVEVVVPALSVTRPVPVVPVAPSLQPRRPRDKRPVCGIIAWVLPVLAVPIGILFGYLAGRQNYEGFQGWAVLGWMCAPLLIALPVSLVLAIVSLCRRERYPSLTVSLLALYVIALAFAVPFGGMTPLLALIVEIVLLVRWLSRRHKRIKATNF